LSNSYSGVITGRGVLLTGPAGLINEGNIGLAGGISDLYGDVSNAGSLAISGRSTVVFWDDVDNLGVLSVGLHSSATFFGDLTGSGVIGPGDKYIEGDLKPGASPGRMIFEGDVHFGIASGLEAELAGVSSGEFDSLEVGGMLVPGGILRVTLIDGFIPQVGDSFDILDFGSLSGSGFNTVDLPELTGRKAWDESNLYTTGIIEVIAMLHGDTDVDWDVDADDLDLFKTAFGAAGDWRTDFNEDGVVDLIDFALMRENFGVVPGPGPIAVPESAIPEPFTAGILTLGGLAILRRRRKV